MDSNPNDVRFFVHSVDPVYADVIPHFSVEEVEVSQSKMPVNLEDWIIRIIRSKSALQGQKVTFLAALDFSSLF
jgi:hypothetical protein